EEEVEQPGHDQARPGVQPRHRSAEAPEHHASPEPVSRTTTSIAAALTVSTAASLPSERAANAATMTAVCTRNASTTPAMTRSARAPLTTEATNTAARLA